MTKPTYRRQVVLDGIPAASCRQLEHLPSTIDGQDVPPLLQADLTQQEGAVFELVRQLLI